MFVTGRAPSADFSVDVLEASARSGSETPPCRHFFWRYFFWGACVGRLCRRARRLRAGRCHACVRACVRVCVRAMVACFVWCRGSRTHARVRARVRRIGGRLDGFSGAIVRVYTVMAHIVTTMILARMVYNPVMAYIVMACVQAADGA